MEWKLFEGDVPHVSTFEFHEYRERAPHAEQPHHQPRLQKVVELVCFVQMEFNRPIHVVDLGCGDGGLLQMIHKALPMSLLSGFDFAPANQDGWIERGLACFCEQLDVFPAPPGPAIHERALQEIERADVVITTEVLEHIARPHEVVAGLKGRYVVASSPWDENAQSHDECHAWAWDLSGYPAMFEAAGYSILAHSRAGFSQVILASSGVAG